jgi:hypothetical protein
MRAFILSILAVAALGAIGNAQTPIPVIVPAMTPATVPAAVTAGVTTAAMQTTLKALQAIKAANDEILKQQAETLVKLDEMEKAANDIKIYTKRS